MKRAKKLPPRPLVPGGTIAWLEVQLEMLRNDWETNLRSFQAQVQHAAHGLHSIHMQDTLRNLNMLYLQIAAHTQALTHAKGKFSA